VVYDCDVAYWRIVFQEWWTHLWLNEGFASWIEYLCVDYCFPEYDIWTQFATSDYTRALDLDALKNSHPIEVLCEIATLFCGIGGILFFKMREPLGVVLC